MKASPSDISEWDRFCGTDRVRNEVIVPLIRARIEHEQPGAVMDLGCGSGYISRTLLTTGCLPSTVHRWTLVDKNASALDFAVASIPDSRVNCSHADVTQPRDCVPEHDFVFACMLLPELTPSGFRLARFEKFVALGGELLLSMPDGASEVVGLPGAQAELATQGVANLSQYRDVPYKLIVWRTDCVVDLVVAQGFSLTEVRHSPPPVAGSASTVHIAFRRVA